MKQFKSVHENDFAALAKFKPKEDEVFIDIGSNRGEGIYSQFIGFGKPITIIGFEPNPLIYQKLKDAIGKLTNVEVHNIGLGSSSGEFDLFVPFYRKWMFDGLSSFYQKEAEDWLKKNMWNYKSQLQSIKKVKCKVETLDSFNIKPYFMKLDVQGFEYEVLKGSIETLKEHSPVLLIESISQEVMEYLKLMGYEFYTFQNERFTLGHESLNTFCIPKSKSEILV